MRPISLVLPFGIRAPIRSFARNSSRLLGTLVFVTIGAFVLSAPLASVVGAETVLVFGEDGMDGADGAPGLPGENGTNGSSATAVAELPFQDNVAEATAGTGGRGGKGGAAVLGSGADGADGGDGGSGADALATATTLNQDFVRAIASGGNGGFGGQGGAGTSLGSNGLRGEFGLIGGNAIANAVVDWQGNADLPSTGLDGEAIAFAGTAGSADGAVAGNASATVSGTATGVGFLDASHRLVADARGGDGGLAGGNAFAEATGNTTLGSLDVEATARPGVHFGSDHTGGDAIAVASGIHAGSGPLNVTAIAVLDDLTGAFEGSGLRQAIASGIATNGAEVTVTAIARGGRDVETRDAVSGSTSGLLRLRQNTRGGDFEIFRYTPLLFGTTRTSLTAENTGGGDLDMLVSVSSIRVPGGPEGDGDVIIGDVIGRSDSGANVRVEVAAKGYRIRQEQLDDPTSSSQIRGISNGGDVSVVADFTSRGASFAESSIIGDVLLGQAGPSVSMMDAVGGETTGRLELLQTATASDGTSVETSLFPGAGGVTTRIGGAGGDATIQLTESGSFQSLLLDAKARGGRGAAGLHRGGDAGDASTRLDGTNRAGGVVILGNARADQAAGVSANRSGDGGNATIDFRATTYGDGHSILIGNEVPVEVEFGPIRVTRHGAHAGQGGNVDPFAEGDAALVAGSGGNAESRSVGRAYGDSEVTVYDYAQAGSSGNGGAGPGINPPASGTGGRGGDASSQASAIGRGASAVLAQSEAFGGFGGRNLIRAGESGNAESSAYAKGFGEATATALASGRKAYAVAEAKGALVHVSADARAGTVSARVTREASGRTRLEAIATYGEALPGRSRKKTTAVFITSRPLQDGADSFIAGHAALGDLVSARPGARVEALGRLSVRGKKRDSSTLHIELDITLKTPESGSDLALVFSDLRKTGAGFETLTFRLEVLGELFGEEVVFDDFETAQIFFESVFMLGQAYAENVSSYGTPAVRAIFDVTTLPGKKFSLNMAAVVTPEPSPALLIIVGLVLLAIRRPSGHSFASR